MGDKSLHFNNALKALPLFALMVLGDEHPGGINVRN